MDMCMGKSLILCCATDNENAESLYQHKVEIYIYILTQNGKIDKLHVQSNSQTSSLPSVRFRSMFSLLLLNLF